MLDSKPAMIIIGILAAIFIYAAKHPSSTFAADGMDPAWDAAVQSSDKTEPTVVIFTADWCGACRQLENDVLSRSDVQEELYHHYNVYSVDLTSPSPQVRSHASKLGISAIPTMIRYDINGREKSRIHNSSAETVLSWLKAGE